MTNFLRICPSMKRPSVLFPFVNFGSTPVLYKDFVLSPTNRQDEASAHTANKCKRAGMPCGAIESSDAAYHARMCVVSSPTNSLTLALRCLTLHGRKTLQFTIANRLLGQLFMLAGT